MQVDALRAMQRPPRIPAHCRSKLLAVDYFKVDHQEIDGNGEYDLEALFIRNNSAIQPTGAKRVLLDTIESLFPA